MTRLGEAWLNETAYWCVGVRSDHTSSGDRVVTELWWWSSPAVRRRHGHTSVGSSLWPGAAVGDFHQQLVGVHCPVPVRSQWSWRRLRASILGGRRWTRWGCRRWEHRWFWAPSRFVNTRLHWCVGTTCRWKRVMKYIRIFAVTGVVIQTLSSLKVHGSVSVR